MDSYRNENLVLLMEECAEVQQACTKILRFGWEGSYDDGESNITVLLQEIGDLLAVLERFEFRVPEKNMIKAFIIAKHEKLVRYAKYPLPTA